MKRKAAVLLMVIIAVLFGATGLDGRYSAGILANVASASYVTSQQLSIPEIAALASNSVVEIYTESVASSGRMRQFVTEGAGSGVIISADGYIVTNNHVIEGSRKITVRVTSGMDYEAELTGKIIACGTDNQGVAKKMSFQASGGYAATPNGIESTRIEGVNDALLNMATFEFELIGG